ncbi:MAG: MerR family DNA-binding protein [Alphaproteobacteria bacterium]|nr:MerR family DNA-binding protein [Alphaproteobacteria bacterium]
MATGPGPRTASGRRVYGPAETRTLAFIRRSRELGFSLDEIRALLALSVDDGENSCAEVRQLAAAHLADVRAKIADLRGHPPLRCGRAARPSADRRSLSSLVAKLVGRGFTRGSVKAA